VDIKNADLELQETGFKGNKENKAYIAGNIYSKQRCNVEM